MNVFHLLRTVVVLLVAVGTVIYSAHASAEERAYQSRSTAVLNLVTGDFVAAGNGTHLGSYIETGNVVPVGGEFPEFLVAGSATLKAANGDPLCVKFAGLLNFATRTITGIVTFDGAPDGRFEDATGSAGLEAQFELNEAGTVATVALVVVGTIDY